MRRGIGCTCVTGSPRVRYQLSAVHIKCDRSPSTTRSLRVARTPLFPLSLARSFSLSILYLSLRFVLSFRAFLSSILPGLPASLRFAQKSLRSTLLLLQLRRSSRIMYQPADLFSIATLTPSTRGKSSYGYVRYGRADPEVRHER